MLGLCSGLHVVAADCWTYLQLELQSGHVHPLTAERILFVSVVESGSRVVVVVVSTEYNDMALKVPSQ